MIGWQSAYCSPEGVGSWFCCGMTTDLFDTRAVFRGFSDADEFLELAKRALEHRPYPKWVEREYRAIFEGGMKLPRTLGAIEARSKQ